MDQMYAMLCDCFKPRDCENDTSAAAGDTHIEQYRKYHGLAASQQLEVTCIKSIADNHIVCGDASGTLITFDYEKEKANSTWQGHSKAVTKVCAETSSTNTEGRVLSASRDLTLKLWSAERSCIQEFKGHELVVSAAAFHPENRNVVCSGSRDNSIALWDVSTGAVTLSYKVSRNLITDICWKGELLAQTSEDKSLRLWDAHNLQVTQTFATKQQILTSCDIYDTQIATSSGGFNGTGCEITLWDCRKGTMPIHEFKGHTEKVHQCCYVSAPDGNSMLLASISADRSVRLWDINRLTELSCYNIGWQVTSLTHISTDHQLIKFGVSSPETGVHILTVDSSHSWQIYA